MTIPFINFSLMRNPANWVVVWLMVAIPMVFLTVYKNSMAPAASVN